MELMNHMSTLHLMGEFGVLNSSHPPITVLVEPTKSTFGISIVSNIDLVDLEVELEYDGDSQSVITVSLQKMVLRYVQHMHSVVFMGTVALISFLFLTSTCNLKSYLSFSA